MTRRERIGSRRHRTTFQQHDATQGGHGRPTYTTDDDWDDVLASWPCELLAARGTEKMRGVNVTSETTHVLFGDYSAVKSITTDMRAVVTSTTTGDVTTYQVVSVLDKDGDGREMRIELKREI